MEGTLIMVACIVYALVVFYKLIMKEEAITDEVRNNFENYKREYLKDIR